VDNSPIDDGVAA